MIFELRHTYFIIFLILFLSLKVFAQEDTSYSAIAAIINIDSTITITASRGLDVQDFIRLSISDESLYKAFKRLRVNSYDFESSFKMYSRKNKNIDHYNSVASQHYIKGARSMNLQLEEYSRRFFKKNREGKSRYYTFELFSDLFYTKGSVRENIDIEDNSKDMISKSLKGKAKQIQELKKLIFSPGSETQVALIGNKTEIFSEKMIPYYDYSISKVEDNNSTNYAFSVILKDEWKSRPSRTVIKSFITYFDAETLEVTKRRYELAYETIAYSFDVKMNIELDHIDDKYIPTGINYDGRWKIALKKPEICRFNISFYNFKKPLQ